MHLNELAQIMRTAGDESRLHIICHLMRNGKSCVSDIARAQKMSMASTSHHLQVMSKDGLVESVREGKRICYRLPKTPLVRGIQKFICAHGDM
jgi:DNA-binding transcriptional ArsR family regulator